MMMSRSDLQGGAEEAAGNQFYGALIPMFLAHDHHDEKDPYSSSAVVRAVVALAVVEKLPRRKT